MNLPREISRISGVQLASYERLERYTTFGVGGKAVIAEPKDLLGLRRLLDFVRNHEVAYYILGGGSNVLFSDSTFEGVIIRMHHLRRFHCDGNDLVIGAGFSTAAAVKRAAKMGLSGFECLVGIPGTVGGAVAMNAGGKYGCVADRLVSVKWMDRWGYQVEQTRDEVNFGYRCSHIPGMVVEARFSLVPTRRDRVAKWTDQVLREKRESQPLGMKNGGCVFKNPPGTSAGKLIDEAGLKGTTVGKAQVSPVHANFIVNRGGAKSRDILDLMEIIQERVERKFSISLAPEIKVIHPQSGRRLAA